ncbi:MAG TPA: hypothetical protein VGR31_12305 [Planctomycetota bacterium]|jgi:chemotaxis protein histidine kinase CheA|nr:hypothetical protein [Planctomycetota bacterium]
MNHAAFAILIPLLVGPHQDGRGARSGAGSREQEQEQAEVEAREQAEAAARDAEAEAREAEADAREAEEDARMEAEEAEVEARDAAEAAREAAEEAAEEAMAAAEEQAQSACAKAEQECAKAQGDCCKAQKGAKGQKSKELAEVRAHDLAAMSQGLAGQLSSLKALNGVTTIHSQELAEKLRELNKLGYVHAGQAIDSEKLASTLRQLGELRAAQGARAGGRGSSGNLEERVKVLEERLGLHSDGDDHDSLEERVEALERQVENQHGVSAPRRKAGAPRWNVITPKAYSFTVPPTPATPPTAPAPAVAPSEPSEDGAPSVMVTPRGSAPRATLRFRGDGPGGMTVVTPDSRVLHVAPTPATPPTPPTPYLQPETKPEDSAPVAREPFDGPVPAKVRRGGDSRLTPERRREVEDMMRRMREEMERLRAEMNRLRADMESSAGGSAR